METRASIFKNPLFFLINRIYLKFCEYRTPTECIITRAFIWDRSQLCNRDIDNSFPKKQFYWLYFFIGLFYHNTPEFITSFMDNPLPTSYLLETWAECVKMRHCMQMGLVAYSIGDNLFCLRRIFFSHMMGLPSKKIWIRLQCDLTRFSFKVITMT